jgi:non-specific serine/threonine protein kinase/serine/threonine-protein kinase
VLEVRRRVLGPEHPDTLISMSNLGILYQKQGKSADAEAIYTKILEVRRRVLGPENRATTNVMVLLAKVWMGRLMYAEAVSLLSEALNGKKRSAPDAWERYDCQSALGAALAAQGKLAEAEPLLLDAYQWLIRRRAEIPWESRSEPEQVRQGIERLYRDWEKPEQASAWRARLQAGERP